MRTRPDLTPACCWHINILHCACRPVSTAISLSLLLLLPTALEELVYEVTFLHHYDSTIIYFASK